MKSSMVFPLLVVSVVIIVSSHHDGASAQHTDPQNMTTDHPNMVTTAQKAMMDAKKVGDMCMKNEQCTKNLGEHAECSMGKCTCKKEAQKSADSMKCMDSKNSGLQNVASMTCLVLLILAKMNL